MIDGGDGFVSLLAQIVTADPDRIFARFDGTPIGFGALDRRSATLAAGLQLLGIARGDRVAVMLRNGPAALAVIWAVARIGAVWVPINVQQRGEGLRYILGHAEPVLVIAEADLLSHVRQSGADLSWWRLLVLGGDGPEARLDVMLEGSGTPTAPLPQADDLFAIIYTSGTTGAPKGVMVTHRMMRLAGEAVVFASDVCDGEVMLMWEPLYHIGGAQLIVVPLLRRVVLAMVPRFSASRFWTEAVTNRATHIHYLGGILQILLKQPPSPLDHGHGVRIAWGGGCPPDVWRTFQDRFGVRVRECYGMTEASSITSVNDGGVVGSVGRPMPWFSVSIEDAQGRVVAPAERGEIVVRSQVPGAIFPGYFRNAAATGKALRAGALHTSDIGSWDAGGNLLFHGRMTDNVRCRGENVSAWEVEHVVAAHPAVEDCAMIGVAAEIGEQDIKLFVKARPGATLTAPELSCWLSTRLAPYQLPRYIAVVDEFARTASQRIMKHQLSVQLYDCWDRLSQSLFE